MERDRRVEVGRPRRRCGRSGRTRRASVSSRAPCGSRLGPANRDAPGGGLDPEPLGRRPMRAARRARSSCAAATPSELERVAAATPDRSRRGRRRHDRPASPSSPARLGVPLGGDPGGHRERLRARQRPPLDRVEAARAGGRPGTRAAPLELGRLGDGRPFVNVASAGLAVGRRAPRRRRSSRGSARSPTRVGAAARGRAPRRRCACAVRVDGATVFDGEAWQVDRRRAPGAFGGGSEIGAADPADGELDVAVLPAGSRLGLARRAWGLRARHDRRAARRGATFAGTWSRSSVPPARSSTPTARSAPAGWSA